MERLSKAIPNNRVSKMVENSKLTKLSLTHEPLDPDTLCSLLRWIDAIRLSRPKKCLHRDFADAVLVAEIISHFFPAKVRIRVRRNNVGRSVGNVRIDFQFILRWKFITTHLHLAIKENLKTGNC